jgi:hypothetical protein
MPVVDIPSVGLVEFPDNMSGADIEEAIRENILKPKTTIPGYVRETLKAVPRGLVSGLETAALGASALLPGDTETGFEKTAREGIKGFAERLKPTAAPGYEDAIPTKLGEAVGSFGSLLIPGGIGGMAARGLGVSTRAGQLAAATPVAGAMGAGEARERAVAAGATPEQITTATQFGVAPGLAEMIPVERVFRVMPKEIKSGMFEQVKRALVTGGVEGAQEAASAIAQNLIAQKVYKPSQELIEGVGEDAAYGAGAGAIVQFLLDAVAGRRAPQTQVQPQQPGQPAQPAYISPTPEQVIAPAPRTEDEVALAQLQQAQEAYNALPIDDPRRVDLAGEIAKYQDQVAQIDAAKAQTSAFAQQQPDLFGMYTAPREERPEFELEAPVAPRGEQLDLPLQQPTEPTVRRQEPDLFTPPEPLKITDQRLTDLGFSKTSKKARDALRGLDLTKATDLERFDELTQDLSGKVKFNPDAVGALVDQARENLAAIKTKTTPPQLLDLGQAPSRPDDTAMELMFAQQRRNEGMPLTPRQEYLLRNQPTPEIITPTAPAQRPLEVVTEPERKPGGQFLTTTDIPKPLQTPEAEPQAEEAQRRRRSKSMPTRQAGLDFEGAPDVTGREAVEPSVVAPVPQPAPGGRAAGVTGPAGVVSDTRDVGPRDGREEVQQPALEPGKPAARKALKDLGVPQAESNKIIKSFDEPTGFDSAAFQEALNRGDFLPLRTGAVGQALPNTVTSKLQAGDLKGALRTLGETGSTPIIRTIARKLLPAIRKTNIVNQAAPDGSLAIYDRATDTIYLDPSVYSEHALLHEATHAAIAHVLDNKLNPLTQKLQKLFDALTPDIKNTYGATNLQEFAAEAMSNPEFQSLLRGQPKNWWGRFVDAVRGFLGLSKAKQVEKTLDQILDVAPTETAQPSTDTLRLETAAPQTFEGKIKKVVADTPSVKAVGKRALDSILTALDSAYPAQESLRKAFSDAERPAIEFAVAMGKFAQAGHLNAVAARGLETGGIAFDPQSGMFSSTQSEFNMRNLNQMVTALADRHGLPYDQAHDLVNEAFEGRRLVSLYKERDNKLAQANALEKGKNKKAAKKIRDDWEAMSFHKTRQEAQQMASLYDQYPELNEIDRIKNGIRNWVMKFAVDSGVMSQDMADTLLSNAEWVPFRREFDPDETASMEQFAKNRLGVQATIRNPKYKGSTREVSDILDNFNSWAMYSTRLAMRNDMTRKGAGEFMKYGMAKPDKSPADPGTENRRVRYYMNGQPEYALFDDPESAVFFNSNMVPPRVSSLLAGFNALFRKSIVGLPTFSVKQLIVDSQEAILKSGLPPRYAMRVPMLAAQQFIRLRKEGTTPEYEALVSRGLAGPYTDIAAVRGEELKALGYKIKDEGQRGMFAKAWEAAELYGMKMAMHSDNAIRQALLIAAQEAGMTPAQSYNMAADYINFKRQIGNDTIRGVAAYVPFFTAAMSAIRSSLMALSGKGITPQARNQALKNYAKNMAMISTLAAVWAVANDEDEEYANMTPEQRARQWTIPGMGGFGIPRRVSIETLMPIFAEMAVNQTTKNAADATALRQALLGIGTEALLPVPEPMPAPVKTAMEQIANHSFFTGEPLVGYGLDKKEAWLQYGASTSSAARGIGEALNAVGLGDTWMASPARIDHITRGLLGSIGASALLLSNMIASQVGTRPGMSGKDLLASIPGMTFPAAKEFNLADKNNFYDMAKRLDEVASTANALLKEGRIEEYQAYVEQNANKIGMDKVVNKIMPQLARIRDALRVIRESDMPNKDEEIRRLRQIEMNFIRSLNVPELRKMAGL